VSSSGAAKEGLLALSVGVGLSVVHELVERSWPDAAASLREGMEETLTVMRFGISGQLAIERHSILVAQ
jgi:hypothetical protein